MQVQLHCAGFGASEPPRNWSADGSVELITENCGDSFSPHLPGPGPRAEWATIPNKEPVTPRGQI